MASQLNVRASAAEFSRYKELVDSDWNRATLDAVLELLWDVVGESATEYKGPKELLNLLRNIHDNNRASAMPKELVDRLTFLSFIFREPAFPKMPTEFAPGTSRIAAQTEAAIAYLLLQIDMRLSGETGFFRDLQSLLYLNSVHYLLPQLQKAELKPWHDSLVNALAIHAFLIWRDEPSHMFYLLGAVMGQLGNKTARLEFLHRSLSATPIDDHSYLTKVSAYWGELLELGKKDIAMDFLLRLSRNAPESYVSEIGGMITETARFKASA